MSNLHDNPTVLIHRVKNAIESARPVRVDKNWLGKYVLKEKLGDNEELVFIRNNGRLRLIIDVNDIVLSTNDKEQGGKFVAVPKEDSPLDVRGTDCWVDGEKYYRLLPEGTFQSVSNPDELPFQGDLRVFAVQEDPFELVFTIDLGQEKEGFHWFLQLGGDAKVENPTSFLSRYYAKAKNGPFTVQRFIEALGTRPANLLLDEILHKSMEVLALDDLNVDVAQWAKERNLTEDAFTEAVAAKPGTPFGTGEVEFTVNSVRFSSPERDEAIAREQIERIAAIQNKKAEVEKIRQAEIEENIKRKEEEEQARKNEARRKEEEAQAEHDYKMAEIKRRMAALSGPRPEIWMEAPLHVQGNRSNTRDCSLVTSGDYGNPATVSLSNRPRNTITVGDLLEFNLRANIDGWLHLYNYGTSGNVSPLFTNRHIFANETYSIRPGGNLHNGWLRVTEKTKTTRDSGRLERFIAIITREQIRIDKNSVKAVFDRRNPRMGYARRGGFVSVEEVPQAEEEVPLEEAMASLLDLPPEDWVQGTLELEVV